MSQTSVSTTLAAAFAGLIAGIGPRKVRSGLNVNAAAMPFGIMVKPGAGDNDAIDLIDSATAKMRGILCYDTSGPNIGLSASSVAGASIPNKGPCSVLESGLVWVAVEAAVLDDDQVFVRIATSVNDSTLTQKGAFRKDADGVAQVATLTPTAVNGTIYVLRITDKRTNKSFVFEAVGDGSATATEIVTSFKTAMAADAAFTALMVASGTATLILTGQEAGREFEIATVGDGAVAIVATTPAAPTAVLVKGARFATAQATAAGVALVEFDSNAAAV